MFKFIKNMYDLHKISAEKVWEYADKKVITSEQAEQICGPRPVKE